MQHFLVGPGCWCRRHPAQPTVLRSSGSAGRSSGSVQIHCARDPRRWGGVHPAEDSPDLQGLENGVGARAPAADQALRSGKRSSLAVSVRRRSCQRRRCRNWDFGRDSRVPKGTSGTGLLRSAQRGANEVGRSTRTRGRPAGSKAPQAWPRQLLPVGLGRGHTRCGGGDFGGPRTAGAAGAAEGGRALGLAARNSAGLQGGAGRRRPAWVTASAAGLSPCLGSNTFFSPSFLTQPHLSSGRRGAR